MVEENGSFNCKNIKTIITQISEIDRERIEEGHGSDISNHAEDLKALLGNDVTLQESAQNILKNDPDWFRQIYQLLRPPVCIECDYNLGCVEARYSYARFYFLPYQNSKEI